MVRGILGDVHVQGHVRYLSAILESDTWLAYWTQLQIPLRTFRELGLAFDVSDAVLWQVCQQQRILLLTGNRNQDGPDSLEATLRVHNSATCLPVLTLANPRRVLNRREYAEQVVERLLEIVSDIDNYLGTGRLYLP
jgi:hypothetical protein